MGASGGCARPRQLFRVSDDGAGVHWSVFGAWPTLPKGMGSSFKVLPDAGPQRQGRRGEACGQRELKLGEDPVGSLASTP